MVGNTMVNGAGVVVRLLGVDRSGTEYQCIHGNGIFDGPRDDASVAAIASWHTNAVRVPLNEDCWLGINGVASAYSGSVYQGAIAAYVDLLVSHGLIPILDLHWNAAGSAQAIRQQPMADEDHAPAFWSSVATTFKNNSAVVFDLYNEPHDISWTCWRDGGSCGTGYQVAGMQQLVDTVRNTGATNVIMAGGLAYANDLSHWSTYKPNDPTGNLAASWHVYNFNACGNTSCYDNQIAPVAASVPLVAGEMGENDCGASFINTTMAWLDAHRASYIGWAWNTFDCSSFPSLISDYAGTPTQFGIGLRDHLAALGASSPTPAVGRATSTSAPATNTPRATTTPTKAAPATATARPVVTATPTPGSIAGGGVVAAGSVASGTSVWWGEDDVNLSIPTAPSALRVVVTFQKTGGVSFAGAYNTFAGDAMTMSHADKGSAIVYTLNAGQTVQGSYLLGSQYNGSGQAHPAGGDSYSMTATVAGATSTSTGHF